MILFSPLKNYPRDIKVSDEFGTETRIICGATWSNVSDSNHSESDGGPLSFLGFQAYYMRENVCETETPVIR